MAIKTKKASEWIAANGAAIAKASQTQMLEYVKNNLAPLQDGVYIGKQQREDWGIQGENLTERTKSSGGARAAAAEFRMF